MKKRTWQQRLLQKYYFGLPNWENGRKQFFRLIEKYAQRNNRILEIGAGPTNKTTAFLSGIGTVTGLDVDPAVKSNVHCQEAVIYDGTQVPFADSIFDLVVSDYVCEHIEHPLELTREIYRVLRPEGRYIFRTPNLWHYVSLVGKFSPHRFHKLVANPLRRKTSTGGIYPTFHRMNTRRACRRVLERAGFSIIVIEMIEKEPSYGMSSRLLFYPFMMWERILNSSAMLENLRANIFCVALAQK